MDFERQAIPDVVLISPKKHGDERGFLMETFRHNEFEAVCGDHRFVQENQTRSGPNILRGLHYQRQRVQGKLVRVVSGEIFDVAVDLRAGSPTRGHWVGCRLSADNHRSLWIPPGFAHGFYVIGDGAVCIYQCTDYYAPDDQVCVHWDDPELAIDWPVHQRKPYVSERDARGLALADAPLMDVPLHDSTGHDGGRYAVGERT